MRIAILTISDAGHRGERDDTSGEAIVAWIGEKKWTLAKRALVPDNPWAWLVSTGRFKAIDGLRRRARPARQRPETIPGTMLRSTMR